LVSLLKCIKIVRTRYALNEAMLSAVATVNLPIFIPATATVIAVSAIRASHTKMYAP
jgi:hypothetical protein